MKPYKNKWIKGPQISLAVKTGLILTGLTGLPLIYFGVSFWEEPVVRAMFALGIFMVICIPAIAFKQSWFKIDPKTEFIHFKTWYFITFKKSFSYRNSHLTTAVGSSDTSGNNLYTDIILIDGVRIKERVLYSSSNTKEIYRVLAHLKEHIEFRR